MYISVFVIKLVLIGIAVLALYNWVSSFGKKQ